MEARVSPRSPKKFFREVVNECPGEDRKVKQINMGSSFKFLMYLALLFWEFKISMDYSIFFSIMRKS